MIENADVICDQFDLRQHMGDNQNRAVIEVGQRFYEVADLMNTGRVKAIGRFIQNQDRRSAQKRPRKPQTLLHAQ